PLVLRGPSPGKQWGCHLGCVPRKPFLLVSCHYGWKRYLFEQVRHAVTTKFSVGECSTGPPKGQRRISTPAAMARLFFLERISRSGSFEISTTCRAKKM